MNREGIKGKARKAVLWDFIGVLITRSGYFIFSIFLARLLAPEDFGLIGMVLIFTGFAQAIVDMGFSTAIIQAKTVNNKQLSTVFYLNVGISFFLTCVLFFASPFVADFYDIDKIQPITQAISFIFIINGLNAVQLALLRRQLKFKVITQAILFSTVIGGASAALAALYGLGVWSLVVQVLLMGLINLIAIWWQSDWKPSFDFELNSIRSLWKFGGYMFLDSIFANVYARVDVFFIGKIFNPAVLGLYLRSKSINNFVVEFSSQSVGKVLFPTISRVQENTEQVRYYLTKSLDIVGLITFFLLGWMYLTASESIIILFGEKWAGSILFYEWLALMGFGYPIGSILINTLRGQGYSRLYFIRSLFIYAVASIAYVFGFFYGIETFVKVLVATTSIGVMVNMYFSKITTGIHFKTLIYHALFFVPVAIAAVILTQFLIKGFSFESLYVIFMMKSLLFLLHYGVFAYFLRKNLVTSILSLYKSFSFTN